jgi:hypothetical protein
MAFAPINGDPLIAMHQQSDGGDPTGGGAPRRGY